MDNKLREIIESKKDDKEVAEFAGITLTLAEYDFLTEKAERTEELEELNEALSETSILNAEESAKLWEQNQRYKQALEDIRNNAREDFFKTDILIIATEALEANE